jgi:uncharacterized protein YciI
MPTWLYRLRLIRPALLTEGATPEEEAAIGRHFTWLQGHCAAGHVLLAGRTTDLHPEGMGIVLFRAADEAAAHAFAQADPAVVAGVMSVHCFPFRVALANGPALAETGRG